MSVPPAGPGVALERQAMLFTPGARLGWIFRDRRKLVTPYPEPQPDLDALREQAAARAKSAEASYQRARKWVARPSLMLGVLLLVLAGCARAISGATDTGATVISALVVCGPGVAWTVWCWYRRDQAKNADPESEYQQELVTWERHEQEHQHAELARLGTVPEWGSAEPPARRTDVFGGSLAGWQALLTTHGTSILAAQPLLVVDMSGQYAAGDLTVVARQAGVQTAAWMLPGDLDRCGLLARLNPSQLADAITEAIHAGTPGGARADRAVDARVLEQLAATLDYDVTPARLAAAAQAALGHPVPSGLLSGGEIERIGLLPAAYRTQIAPNLVRLDAFLSDLARYTGAGPPVAVAPAYYTCLAIESGARSARTEMLTALAIQWLTVQVSASTASAPAVMVAGADEITRAHLERLADACEHRDVPLTLLFRHLREDALHLLGGGAAAFMRLGNHAEADQAASYIGRHHRFVLSQLTATTGGNQTTTRTDTESYGITGNRGFSSTRGWQEDHSGSRSRSGGLTRTVGTSVSRNWSTGMSWAEGTNWSDAATAQRVYEYAVEPTVLQHLPDHALLLAAPSTTEPDLRPVDCNPAIVTLPRVSITPLDAPSRFAPGGALPPADMQIGWPAGAARQEQPAWPASPARHNSQSGWWQQGGPPDQRG
ncbi:MAG: hypothetical protein JO345_08345 [Streptosporangiaceae bacterium]|nr:hypothetical protein [Streptosporangiaceae bacterium]